MKARSRSPRPLEDESDLILSDSGQSQERLEQIYIRERQLWAQNDGYVRAGPRGGIVRTRMVTGRMWKVAIRGAF